MITDPSLYFVSTMQIRRKKKIYKITLFNSSYFIVLQIIIDEEQEQEQYGYNPYMYSYEDYGYNMYNQGWDY
jgi:hypothetical protein